MKNLLLIASLVAFSGSALSQTSSFTPGRLVVVSAGPDGAYAGNAACPVSLLEYPVSVGATSTASLTLPSASGDVLFTNSANASSNLNLQFNGQNFILMGYNAPAGTPSITGTNVSAVTRVVAIVPVAGTVDYVVLNDAYSANNARGAYQVGADIWTAGTGSGASGGIRWTTTGPTSVPVQSAPGPSNTRVVTAWNGDLYFSTMSGTFLGIYKIDGLATEAATTTPLMSAGAGASPYDFVFVGNNTCYVADDRGIASGGGLYKFTFDGSAWNLAYLITNGLPAGLRAVTYLGNDGGGNPQFAVVSNETGVTSQPGTGLTVPNSVLRVTDAGTAELSTSELLFDGPTTHVLRGIRYIPGSSSNQNLTGTLALGDTVGGSFLFNRNIAYEVKQGVTTIASGTITASASSTALNISVPAANTGAAQLILNGSSFLRRVVAINLTGSNQAIGTATMQNGDVNNSGEVDAVDIDDVVANFGFLGDDPTDVDVNGEVDAVDIDIVIANFGGLDD